MSFCPPSPAIHPTRPASQTGSLTQKQRWVGIRKTKILEKWFVEDDQRSKQEEKSEHARIHTHSLSQPRIPKLPNIWTSPAVPDHKSAGISDGRRDSTRPLLGLTGRLYKLQPAARAPMDWHHHRQQSNKLHRFSLLSAFFFQSLILKFYAGDKTHRHFRKNKTFEHFQNETTKYPGLGGGVGYAFSYNIHHVWLLVFNVCVSNWKHVTLIYWEV